MEELEGGAAMEEVEGSVFKQLHERNVRPWLDLVDELRSHGVSEDIPLPQIAVMGDQSCGKSSVLEAISGVPFPRGSGLVTRCATQLVMKSGPPGSEWSAHATVMKGAASGSGTAGGGGGGGGKDAATAVSVSSPAALTKVISDLQDSLTGGSQTSFSTDTILIQVQAEGLPDLTLIDLPGIVRTATAGQKASVMGEVNALIDTYLGQERTIILAVVPANQDVATVDILERAKAVDPQGDRTIGVLTKPDLIGPGNEEEALTVLRNVRKPLKLGYVMVKCRSQTEINAGVSNREAVVEEARFFRQHSCFSALPASLTGVATLTTRLTELLVRRIEAAMPSIKWEIQQQMLETEKLLQPMVKGVPQDEAECQTCLMKVVSEYSRLLRQSARGYYRDDVLSARPALRLHAECQLIFRQLHRNIAATIPGFNDNGFGERLALEMQALRGKEMPGFLNHQVFYGFMIQNVESWRPAVEVCRSTAANATLTVASLLIDTLAVQFPRLCGAVRDALSGIVETRAEEVSVRIDEIFQKESDPFTTNEGMLEVINTIRFRHFDKALEDAMDAAGEEHESMADLKASVQDKLGAWYMRNHGVGTMANVEDMCTLLQAYWNVATKRLVDNVCMTMEQDFVVHLLSDVESELFLLTNREGGIEELFVEDTSVIEKRRSLQAKYKRLGKGLEALMLKAPGIVAERPKSVQWQDGFDDDALQEARVAALSLGGAAQEEAKAAEAELSNRFSSKSLMEAAEERSQSSKWGATTWARSKPVTTMHADPAPGFGSGVGGGGGGGGEYQDHYNLPVRPQQMQRLSSAQQQQPQPALPPPQQQQQQQQLVIQPEGNETNVLVERLVDLGFPRSKVIDALAKCDNNPDLAAERLMTESLGGEGGGGGGAASGAGSKEDGNSSSSSGRRKKASSSISNTSRALPADFAQQASNPAAASKSRPGGGGGASSASSLSASSPSRAADSEQQQQQRLFLDAQAKQKQYSEDAELAAFLAAGEGEDKGRGAAGGASPVGVGAGSGGGSGGGGYERGARDSSKYTSLFGEDTAAPNGDGGRGTNMTTTTSSSSNSNKGKRSLFDDA